MTFRRILGPRSGGLVSGEFTVSGPYDPAFEPTDLIKTQLHCHTTQSDGSHTPATIVAGYVAAGYRVLAITDHDKVTAQPAGVDFPLQGNELSPTAHHIVSLDSTYTRGGTTDAQSLVDGVLGAGGQCHVAHPLWWIGMNQAEMLALEGHLGFEIHNGHTIVGSGQNPVTFPGVALSRWDALLAAGQRSGVWGFAVDDLHVLDAFRVYDMGGLQVFVENESAADVVASLVDGNFVAEVANFAVTPGYPVRGDEDVSVECPGATRIEAWSKDGLLSSASGDSLTVDYPFDGTPDWVRLVAVGDYTEPWNAISDRWGVLNGTWAVSSGVLSVSSDDGARRIILRRHRQGDFAAQTDFRISGSGLPRANLMFNVLNSSYYFIVHIGRSADGAFDNKLAIAKTTDGSNFGTPLASDDFTPTLDTWYTVKLDYAAATGTIRAKVWETGTSEPDWQISASDTTWTWGAFGYRANRSCSMDNLYIDGFQTFYQPIFIDPA